MGKPIFSFRNTDGTPLEDLIDNIPLSGSETVPFRIYNNYSGAEDISYAYDFSLFPSANNIFQLIDNAPKSGYYDVTEEFIKDGRVEIRCTFSSKLGEAPSDTSFVEFSEEFKNDEFDTIYAYDNNYNEYEIKFSNPDNDNISSGSVKFSLFTKWKWLYE